MGMKAPKEQDLVKQIIEYLHHRNIYSFRLNSGKVQTAHKTWVQLAPKGATDVIGILPGGRWLAVEAKRPGKKPCPEQEAWMNGMAARGALCVTVTDVRELEAALAAEGIT